jgi:nucleotide-binding universal stress UspA family protein
MTVDYLPQRSVTGNRVVAVFDGSPSAFRAIELANNLAESSSGGLTVLIITNNADERSRQCLTWLQERGIRAEINQASGSSDEAIIDYVRKYPPAILLINRDSDVIAESQIQRLVNEFDCPLILC